MRTVCRSDIIRLTRLAGQLDDIGLEPLMNLKPVVMYRCRANGA
jgi:hypothetical protein